MKQDKKKQYHVCKSPDVLISSLECSVQDNADYRTFEVLPKQEFFNNMDIFN